MEGGAIKTFSQLPTYITGDTQVNDKQNVVMAVKGCSH